MTELYRIQSHLWLKEGNPYEALAYWALAQKVEV